MRKVKHVKGEPFPTKPYYRKRCKTRLQFLQRAILEARNSSGTHCNTWRVKSVTLMNTNSRRLCGYGLRFSIPWGWNSDIDTNIKYTHPRHVWIPAKTNIQNVTRQNVPHGRRREVEGGLGEEIAFPDGKIAYLNAGQFTDTRICV